MPGVSQKGGKGSGNFQHAGRPGEVGGSARGGPSDQTLSTDLDVSALIAARNVSDPIARREAIEQAFQNVGKGLNSRANSLLSENIDPARARTIVDNRWDDTYGFYADMPDEALPWGSATDEVREMAKIDIAKEISKRSGVDPLTVGQIVAQWSISSNLDAASASLQEAAAEEFGLGLSDYQRNLIERSKVTIEKNQKKYESTVEDRIVEFEDNRERERRMLEKIERNVASGKLTPEFMRDNLKYCRELRETAMETDDHLKQRARQDARFRMDGTYPLAERSIERKVLRSMYDLTQEKLREAGIKELTLFRGTAAVISDFHPEDLSGQKIDYVGNSLESFTLLPGIARRFSYGARQVIGMRVPASKVFCYCRTGFGCLTEGEFVIMGNSEKQPAQIIWDGRYN